MRQVINHPTSFANNDKVKSVRKEVIITDGKAYLKPIIFKTSFKTISSTD
ncbi:MAG: hypothetical protein J0H68_08360 [Sphingobacteriia bacterium]|nr:hypothetical protein [Sphingobacteriia bacterium]